MSATSSPPSPARLAHRVMVRLGDEDLDPTPANYTLWFVYYSGELPDLNRAMDVLIVSGQKFSQAKCDELSRRFFSTDAEMKAVRDAGERTQAALARLMELLQQAGVEGGRYGETLTGFSKELSSPLSPERLREMLEEIATETRSMIEEHCRLHSRFSETSAQLAQLRADLTTAQRLAVTDGLTGILNRRGFELALAEAASEASTADKPLCLLMVDIDNFKTFNDTHGHAVGDMVLRLVARVLSEGVTRQDVVARFGGEEFAVILPGVTLADAGILADRLRRTVSSRQLINRSRNENFGTITFSAGLTLYHPNEPLTNLIQRADMALYDAKHKGRNRVTSLETDATHSL